MAEMRAMMRTMATLTFSKPKTLQCLTKQLVKDEQQSTDAGR